MDQYQLGETHTLEANLVADIQLADNAVHMRVQSHSRMQNLLGFALNKIKGDDIAQVVWSGEGPAIQKVINCADIMKKKNKGLYMLSRKGFKRVEEYWDPIYQSDLDRLKVNRDTEAVAVLLSKLPLDAYKHESGYLDVGEVPASLQSPQQESQEKKGARTRTRQRPPQKHNKPGSENTSTHSHPGNNHRATDSSHQNHTEASHNHHQNGQHSTQSGRPNKPRSQRGGRNRFTNNNNNPNQLNATTKGEQHKGAGDSTVNGSHNGADHGHTSRNQSHIQHKPKNVDS